MTPAELTAAVDAYLERLIQQQPIAILQYGSSLRPEDFVAGQSDLDLIVISDEPLRDVDNALGYHYAFISPRDFVAGVASGDMFWLSALASGRVRHDPRRLFANLFALIDSGFDVRPNLVTIRSCAALIGAQLGRAMDGYFSRGGDPGPLYRLLYSAAKAIGGYLAIASTGVDPHGFDGIVRSLGRFPEVAELMQRTRARMRSPGAAVHEVRPRTHVEDDPLGRLILEIEAAYVREVALLPGRRMTNALIDDYQAAHGPIRRTLLVRMDMAAGSHTIVGQVGEDPAGGYCVFGLGDARHPRGGWFARPVASRAALEAELGAGVLGGLGAPGGA